MEPAHDILMVEDSESDATLALEAVERGNLANNFHHVKDGDEALRYLFKKGEYTRAVRPGLVLLDLNMPGTDGWEVLTKIRENLGTSKLSVIVMTSSSHDEAAHTANGLKADGYLIKPVSMKSLQLIAQTIQSFEVQIVNTTTE